MSEIRVLCINHDQAQERALGEKLTGENGCSVIFESLAEKAFESFKHNSFDLVLVKLTDSEQDNINLVRELKNIDTDCVIIGIVDTANNKLSEESFMPGVYGIIRYPLNPSQLSFFVQKGAEFRSFVMSQRKLISGLQEQNSSLQKQNILMAKRIEESTTSLSRLYENLRSTYMRTIKVLAEAIDARDHYTHSHSENVAKYAEAIAREMHLPVKEVEMIREACELHDLGKIGIADNILSKPSSLTPQEWEQVKRHPATGAQILEPLTFLNGVTDLVKQHHEHYDGSGYPQGLKGEEIMLGARIINLADAYDTMRSARSYRKVPFSKEEAVLEIKLNRGQQFDPNVVDAFFSIVDTLETL
ncbi:MAG: HD domain-containing protein [Candidatus Omnitrophica bacterium]|nr:HD domain-containing protein [Candidatus Omnitrophota bacterium]